MRRCVPLLVVALAFGMWMGAPASAFSQSSGSPASAFDRAQTLYDRGLYASAATALSDFRRAHPRHSAAPEALYLEIRSMQALDRTEEAFRLTEELQRRYPRHPEAGRLLLAISEDALERGDGDTARAYLERLREDGDSEVAAPATALLAQHAHREGRSQEALSLYIDLVQSHPDHAEAPEAAFRAGQLYLQRDRPEDATRAFQTVINRYSDSPFAEESRDPLAEAHARLEQYEEAIDVLEAASHRSARANQLLGYAYLEVGNWHSAERALTDATEGGSPDASIAYGLGWAAYHQGNHEQAAEYFAQVGNSDHPAAQTARFEAARNLQQVSRTHEARDAYAAYIDVNPSDERADEAMFEVGRLYYQDGDYDQAGQTMQRLLRSYAGSEKRGQAHLMLGNVALQREDLPGAMDAFDEAIDRGAAPDSIRDAVEFQQAWSLYESRQYRDAADAFLNVHERGQVEQRQEALFWAGESLFQEGAHAQSRTHLQRYVSEAPRGESAAAARYTIAWSYFKEEDYESAASAFQQFLDAYDGDTRIPYRADAQLRLGDSYFALRRYEDAIAAYQNVEDTGRDYALFQIGEAYNLLNDPESATEAFDELVASYDDDSRWHAEALYRRGRVYFQMQDYEAARSSYAELLASYPDHPLTARAQYGIGDAYFNRGDMDDAIAAYRQVLENHPESDLFSDAAAGIQSIFVVRDDVERGSELIEEIADQIDDPNRRDALRFRAAETVYQSGDTDQALRQLRQFVRTAHTDAYLPEAYFLLGRGHASQQEPDEARTYFEQLIGEYEDHRRVPDASLRLGELLAQSERYDEALIAYQRAADHEAAPTDIIARARYGEAVALLNLDRRNDAETLLRALAETSDSDRIATSAQLGLGRLAEDRNELEAAERLYREVADAASNETGAEAQYRLGRLLRLTERHNEALTELDRIPTLYSGYPDWVAQSYLEQARTYNQMGQTGEAQRLYDRVISSYGGTPFAEEAQEERVDL